MAALTAREWGHHVLVSSDLDALAVAPSAGDEVVRAMVQWCRGTQHPDGELDDRIVGFYESLRGRYPDWCDGLVAEQYDLLPPTPCVRGRAWCGPDGQQPWEFKLLLDPNTDTRIDIDWSALFVARRRDDGLVVARYSPQDDDD